jgi:hypothetical protein
MTWRWLPWKFVLRRLVRSWGFVDPLAVINRLEQLSQPSEVTAPIELLRAGAILHARGLLNATVFQSRPDWIWPYWVRRQFDPSDVSYTPRAFSLTYVNLSHRNWTAVGLPGCRAYPIVDPRGMVTPFFAGWSIDAWIVDEDGRNLLPPRVDDGVRQELLLEEDLTVRTDIRQDGRTLARRTSVRGGADTAICHIDVTAGSDTPAWLAIVLRPYNPEGVGFLRSVEWEEEAHRWRIDRSAFVRFDRPPDRHLTSTFREGDVHTDLLAREPSTEATCNVEMATAAALYRIEPRADREVSLEIDLSDDRESRPLFPIGSSSWNRELEGTCDLQIPDDWMQHLFRSAVRTVILHSPRDAYPGPYTYKRFWYRDAAYIVHALMGAGCCGRAETVLDRFLDDQKRSGFFCSQNGEWDANGQALWSFARFCELTATEPKPSWRRAVRRGARWILSKRLPGDGAEAHAGLLPAGFSAEHLGPNDYHFWDDYWSAAGLRGAADLVEDRHPDEARRYRHEADGLLRAVERSLLTAGVGESSPLPTSPYRRPDSASVGSLVAGYPLRLLSAGDPRLAATARFLLERYRHRGAYYHDIVHAGINAYLSLHIAQVLLRAGDPRFFEIVRAVADLASPTGQWPEAIHPRSLGGCMGDGQHVWAASDWLMMLRNMFVREEEGRLVLVSGIPEEWLASGEEMRLGPTPTPQGPLTVTVVPASDRVTVRVEAEQRPDAPPALVRLVSGEEATLSQGEDHVTVRRAREPKSTKGRNP